MGKVEQKKMSRGGGSQRDLSWEYDPKCVFFFFGSLPLHIAFLIELLSVPTVLHHGCFLK